MEGRLQSILKGKIVIVGVGSILRGDDGLGPFLIERLKGRIRAVCIDAGTAPESYCGKIAQEAPDTVLIVDAVHLDRTPGAWDILKEDEILKSGFTTHDISPRMFIEYLKTRTKAGIYMLGVQPLSLSLGEGISAVVAKTLKELEESLKEVLGA